MNQATVRLLEEASSLPMELQQEVLDFVLFLKSKSFASSLTTPSKRQNGDEMVKLMASIAQRGTAFNMIDDPVAWQIEVRKDRPLPRRKTVGWR